MADITDLSSEGKEEEGDEVPHLPLDNTEDDKRLPGDSVADSGMAQSGDVSTPRDVSSTMNSHIIGGQNHHTSKLEDTSKGASDPVQSPDAANKSNQHSRIPVVVSKSRGGAGVIKRSVYSSSSGTASSEEMNRTVIEKDEDSASETYKEHSGHETAGLVGELAQDWSIHRLALLKHDKEVIGQPGLGDMKHGDWQTATGSSEDSNQLRASLLDRVDLVDEDWSEEGPCILEIDGPDPCSPRQDAQTQAGPSQTSVVHITASPSSAFQTVRPSVRPQAGHSVITPHSGTHVPQPSVNSGGNPPHHSPEYKPVSPVVDSYSEGLTHTSDSYLYTASTELAPYMATSCALLDDTQDTLQHLSDLNTSPQDMSHPASVVPVPTDDTTQHVQAPDSSNSDSGLKSPPSVSRVRRGSYTLDHPSPALLGAARDQSLSDPSHSSKTSSGKSRASGTSSSEHQTTESDKSSGAKVKPATDVPSNPTAPIANPQTADPGRGYPLTTSMEDLQLLPVQRKLDYDKCSSTQENVHTEDNVNNTSLQPRSTQDVTQNHESQAPPQVPDNQGERPDLTEAVGSEQEGKQEHLARYLEHLSQMPLSSPSTDSPRYSAPPSAERNLPHQTQHIQELSPTPKAYPSHPHSSIDHQPQGYQSGYGYSQQPGNHGNVVPHPSDAYNPLIGHAPVAMPVPSLSDPDLDLLHLQAQQFDLMRRQLMQQQQQQLAHLLAEQERQQLLLQQDILTQQMVPRGKSRAANKRQSDGRSAIPVQAKQATNQGPYPTQAHQVAPYTSRIPGPVSDHQDRVGQIVDFSQLSFSKVSSQDARPQTAPVPKVSFNLDSSHLVTDDSRNTSYVDHSLQSPAVLRTKQVTVPGEVISPRPRSVVSQNVASPEVLSRAVVHLDPKVCLVRRTSLYNTINYYQLLTDNNTF